MSDPLDYERPEKPKTRISSVMIALCVIGFALALVNVAFEGFKTKHIVALVFFPTTMSFFAFVRLKWKR